jgi:hypothetical protein
VGNLWHRITVNGQGREERTERPGIARGLAGKTGSVTGGIKREFEGGKGERG